jgi:plastocyanin
MDFRIAVAVGLAAILAAVLAPVSTLTPAFAAEVAADVTVGSTSKTTDAYAPNPLEINVGDTVTWTNKDSQPHTVTSGSGGQPDGKFDSSPNFNPLMLPQGIFSHTFNEAGEFPYYCGLHPNMVGTVMVSEGGEPEPTGPSMMLEGTSTSGDFMVQVDWTSNEIGKENTFNLKFFDAEGNELSDVTYSIMLFKGDQHLNESHREDQTAAQQKYTFDGQGSYTLRIENINGSGTEDGIDIPMQVTPEFPILAALVLATAIAGIVGYTRFARSGTGFFGRA